MGLCLFDELDHENAAHCRLLGLDPSPYVKPLSPAEVQTAEHMQRHGINRKAASMLIACNNMPARTVAMGPRKPAANAVIEYARTPEQLAESTRLFGESLGKFYDACRRRTIAPVFCGD